MLALGTTDAANIAAGAPLPADRRIDRMMAVIGSDPVLWVDVKTLRTDGPWQNSSMLAWNEAAHRGRRPVPEHQGLRLGRRGPGRLVR